MRRPILYNGFGTLSPENSSCSLPHFVLPYRQQTLPTLTLFRKVWVPKCRIPRDMGTSTKQHQASFSGKFDLRKPKNADVRPREYLTDSEVGRLMKGAAKTGRHRHRDSTLILVTYRHGFRVAELIALRWDQVELDAGRLHVSRVKDGIPSVHPIRGPEIRALRRLRRDYPDSPYLFVTERGGPLILEGLKRAARRLGWPWPVEKSVLT